MLFTRMMSAAVTVLVATALSAAPALASSTDRGPAFDTNVDVRTLTAADVADLSISDLPELPPQVREALVTPVGYGSSELIADDGSNTMTGRTAALAADVCYTLTRDTWKTNVFGFRIMQVRNKARVCTDDGIYISETPIDLSQAWGSLGWVFSAWETNSSGFCSSTHLQWYHLLNARFRYGPFEVVRLANQTTFLGSGGLHAGYC